MKYDPLRVPTHRLKHCVMCKREREVVGIGTYARCCQECADRIHSESMARLAKQTKERTMQVFVLIYPGDWSWLDNGESPVYAVYATEELARKAARELSEEAADAVDWDSDEAKQNQIDEDEAAFDIEEFAVQEN